MKPVDSNPDVVGLRDCLTIPKPKFIEFGKKSLTAFLGDLSIMREEVAAVQIPLCEHAGHGSARRSTPVSAWSQRRECYAMLRSPSPQRTTWKSNSAPFSGSAIC